ncbi:polysaccharide deacetylase family protein [Streptomyces sp. NPDC004752]
MDAMSSWINKGHRSVATLSRGEYSAYVIPRILDLLARHDVTATFFIPGHSALAWPDLIKCIRDAGHEIGHHGWVHERTEGFSLQQERDVLLRGFDALEKAAAVRPVGYRSPSSGFGVNTITALTELGLLYDSTCCAADFVPYYLRLGDAWSADQPYQFGAPCDLVEIPFTWVLDDYPHFEYVPGSSGYQASPSAVYEIWTAEFDYAMTNYPGGVFDLCMHPQIIGRPHRIMMLERLIEYMSERDVRFESVAAYASRWRDANPLTEWVASKPVQAAPYAITEL